MLVQKTRAAEEMVAETEDVQEAQARRTTTSQLPTRQKTHKTRRLLKLPLLARVRAVVDVEVEEVSVLELLDHKTLDRVRLAPGQLPPKPTHSSTRPPRVVTNRESHSRLRVRRMVQRETTVEVAGVLDVVEPVELLAQVLLPVAMPSQLRNELLVMSEA